MIRKLSWFTCKDGFMEFCVAVEIRVDEVEIKQLSVKSEVACRSVFRFRSCFSIRASG